MDWRRARELEYQLPDWLNTHQIRRARVQPRFDDHLAIEHYRAFLELQRNNETLTVRAGLVTRLGRRAWRRLPTGGDQQKVAARLGQTRYIDMPAEGVMRHRILPSWVLACSLLLFACDGRESVGSWAKGLVSDPPLPTPVAIVIACDNSSGSTCGQVELASNIDAALQVAAARPRSSVAVWSFGADVAATREIARVTSPEASTRGDRAQAAQTRQWVESSRADVLHATRVIFDGPQLRSSPIAEGISAIALSRREPNTVLVVISDALQCTRETFDFECKRLPSTTEFLARLKALSLLTPGSLTGTRVLFANARIAPVGENRCAMSVSRVASVRSLWSTAITNAGGTVRFTTDAVSPAELEGT